MASPLGLTKKELEKVVYSATQQGNPADIKYRGGYNSLFNGSKFYHRPSMGDNGAARSNPQTSINNQSNDNINDLSTGSIIRYTQQDGLESMELSPKHFAYNRKRGVYPNNRLVVVRRFPSPVSNDLTSVRQKPISTVVTWIPDDTDKFFSFSASERWSSNQVEDPLGDLTDLFNKMFKTSGGKLDVGKAMGSVIGGLTSKLPIGGFPEAIQTEFLNSFLGEEGQDGTNFNYRNIVQGNPNFLAESAFRNPNSIEARINIPITVEYEMEYYPGVDPNIVFLDLIQNVLRFVSSESRFFLSQTGGGKVNKFLKKYQNGDWVGAIDMVVESAINATKSVANNIGDFFKDSAKAISEEGIGAIRKIATEAASKLANTSIARYRIEFSKIIPALTGSASAPWHITIGNPKKPFFSAGDMVVDNVNIDMGNTLGYNDLPTRITLTCNVRNARNLGIQEIFDMFNIGAGRQYQLNTLITEPDFYQQAVFSGTEGTIGTNGDERNVPPSDVLDNNAFSNRIPNIPPVTGPSPSPQAPDAPFI